MCKMDEGVAVLLVAGLLGLSCSGPSGMKISGGKGGAGGEAAGGTVATLGGQGGQACPPLAIGTQPVALASQQPSPWAIATDGANVVWLNLGKDNSAGKTVGYPPWGDGQVVKYAIDGCDASPSAIASGLSQFYQITSASGIATDGTNVYWSDAGDALTLEQTGDLSPRLLKCAVGGCENAPLALGAFHACAIAVNSTNIYWTNGCAGSPEAPVLTCPIAGCDPTPTTLWSADGGSAVGLAIDANSVYWSTTFEVMKCPLGGCKGSPAVLASFSTGLTNLGLIALDADNIYFIGTNFNDALPRILVCAKAGCADRPVTLATAADPQASFVAIATDGTSVYWTESSNAAGGGVVRRCGTSGCAGTPETIASGLNYPGGIAVDTRNVYWTESGLSSDDGKVWAVAKP